MPGRKQPDHRDDLDRIWRRLLSHFLDLAAFSCSVLIAFELRFDGDLPARILHPMFLAMFVWAGLQSLAFLGFRVSSDHWRHTSSYDAARVLIASLAGSIAGGSLIWMLLGPRNIPHSVYVLDWLMASMLTLGGRLAVRVVITARMLNRSQGGLTRTLIYGAGSAGLALILELRQNESLKCDVIGLIDDDPRKANLNLHG